MFARRKILYAVLPLGCLLLPGQAYAGRATEEARQPPLKIVNYALRSQAIEPTKMGYVPGQQVLAARAEVAPAAPTRSEIKVANLQIAESALEIVPWQRDCAAMGYPANYLGIVTGETWRDSRGDMRRDVWLSNNCMAPQAEAEATAIAEAATPSIVSGATEMLAARQPPEEQPEAGEATIATHNENEVVPPLEPDTTLQGTASQDSANHYVTMTTPEPTTAALVTPRLPGGMLAEATIHQTAELQSTAALVTPRLELAALNHQPAAGVTDYSPEPPIRAGGWAASAMLLRGFVDSDLTELLLASEETAPPDETMQRLEALGQKLAVNRLARVTVTAYASMTPERDARAARRFSLNRALAVRDALMLGGAGSEQVRLRALGANVPSGAADRVDISEN